MNHTESFHVLYIITKLELGGAQKVCLTLFNGLQQDGITTNLISGHEGILVDQVKDNANVMLLSSLHREIHISAIIQDISSFISLIKEIRRLKKQYPNLIVHTHSTKAGILGRWAAWCVGVKTRVHTIHGFAFHAHQPKIIWILIYCLELVTSLITTHFICVSSADVKNGIQLLPNFAKKYSIIRAAVDWNQFYTIKQKEFPADKEPFIFGTVACFKKQKNIFDLLQAFALVHTQNPNTRLEIIGDGHLRTEIETWIEQRQLDSVITLHGWQHNVASFMNNWHAFTLSSLWEGLPCAIVEARLLKLPVISYNTGGISDVIIDKKNGLLIKQGQWQQLASAMTCVATNQILHNTLQHYQESLSDYYNDTMISRHKVLYAQLVKGK